MVNNGLGIWWARVNDAITSLKGQRKSVDDLDDLSTQETLLSLFRSESVDPHGISTQLNAVSDKSNAGAREDLNDSLLALKRVLNEINNLALTVIKDVVRGLADASTARG